MADVFKKHGRRIAREDANMPDEIRNVLSPPGPQSTELDSALVRLAKLVQELERYGGAQSGVALPAHVKAVKDDIRKLEKRIAKLSAPHSAMQGIEPGLRNMASRMENGERAFIEVLMQRGGISEPEARKVLRVYRKLKTVKEDAVNGTIRAKHGGFLDRAVILRALESEIL